MKSQFSSKMPQSKNLHKSFWLESFSLCKWHFIRITMCHINFCKNRKKSFLTVKKLLKCQTKKFRCRKRGHSNKLFLQEHISVLTQYCSSSTFFCGIWNPLEMESQFYIQLVNAPYLKTWILLFWPFEKPSQ